MVPEPGDLRSGCQYSQVLMTTLFWAVDWLASCIITQQRAENTGKLSGDSCKGAKPSYGGFHFITTTNPNYLPKASSPNSVTQKIKVSTYGFQGDTNISSVTAVEWNILDGSLQSQNRAKSATVGFNTENSARLSLNDVEHFFMLNFVEILKVSFINFANCYVFLKRHRAEITLHPLSLT